MIITFNPLSLFGLFMFGGWGLPASRGGASLLGSWGVPFALLSVAVVVAVGLLHRAEVSEVCRL